MKTAAIREGEQLSPFAQSILDGLQEALAWSQGHGTARVITYFTAPPPPAMTASRIAALRRKLAMSPHQFAALLCVSPTMVERWEAGRSKPTGPALRLLQSIADPESMARILSEPPRKERIATRAELDAEQAGHVVAATNGAAHRPRRRVSAARA